MKSNRGFSLIELMIVVVVIGILASIAIPNYQDYLIKSRRATAKAHMLQIASKEEEYFNSTRNYTTGVTTALPTGLGLTNPPELSGYYTFAVTLPSTGTFLITATATGSQTSDGNLTLDSSGAKLPANKW